MNELVLKSQVLKVDSTLGLVLGWAIVCKEAGKDYFDLQGDHITEAAMLSAAADFMVNSRVAKEMHSGEAQGTIVFAFPLTTDIKKAFGIQCDKTGLLVAMRPSATMFEKFKSGEYTGFSIGGTRIRQEDVANG